MKTTIDSAGRLVIPKEIRREADLKPGMVLNIRCQNGRIEIEPSPVAVKFVRKGRLTIAVRESSAGELTAATVEETRRNLRHGRERPR